MEYLFSWIHLSDMHMGHGNSADYFDQATVCDALVRDVASLLGRTELKTVPQPRAIFVTGDVAFSGGLRSSTEYSDASTWLAKLATTSGCAPSDIYIVPGNHDVERETAVPAHRDRQRLVRTLRHGDECIDDALRTPADTERLNQRFANYLAFVNAVLPNNKVRGELYWNDWFDVGTFRVHVLGLNTALLASGDDDRGKLRIGVKQVAESFAKLQQGDLNVLLTHHPFDWLHDGPTARGRLLKRMHIHLCGHEHAQVSGAHSLSTGESFVQLSAGAVHAERGEVSALGHRYSVGAIGVEHGTAWLTVWPRRFYDCEFRSDAENLKDGQLSCRHRLSWTPPQDESELGNGVNDGDLASVDDLRAEVLRLRDAVAELKTSPQDVTDKVELILRRFASGDGIFTDKNPVNWARVVKEELSCLSDDEFRSVARSMVDLVIRENESADLPSLGALNAVKCLAGSIQDAQRREVIRVEAARLAEHRSCAQELSILIHVDSTWLTQANSSLRARLMVAISQKISKRHVREMISQWIANGTISEAEKAVLLSAARAEFVDCKAPTAHLAAVLDFNWPELDQIYFSKVVELVSDSAFEQANAAMKAIQGLSAEHAERIVGLLRGKYVLAVASAARGDYPAWEAEAIVGAGLQSRSVFAVELPAHLQASAAADTAFAGRLWWSAPELIRLLRHSDCPQAVVRAVVGMLSTGGRPLRTDELLTELALLKDSQLGADLKCLVEEACEKADAL